MVDPVPQPQPHPYTSQEIELLKPRVETALDKVRPMLQHDGGDASLLDITPEGVAIIELEGHCQSCSLSPMTMKLGIERVIMVEVPEIRAVETGML